MLDLDIPIIPRKGHIIVGARQKPVMMRKCDGIRLFDE